MKTSKRLLALVLAFLLAFGSVPTAVYADEGASEPAVEESAPAPKQESAPAPAPKQEAPKQEAPKQEAPKQEAPKQEAPAPEAQPEAPKQEAQPEAPKPEAQPEAPAPETQEPQPETQAPEQSGGAQPEADAPEVNENTDNNSPEDGGVSQEKEAEKEPEAQPEEAGKKAQEKKAETFTVTFELVKEDGERIDRLEEEFKDGDALKVTEKLQQKLVPLAEKDYDLVWHLDARDGKKIDLAQDVVKVTKDMTVFIVAKAPEKEEKAPEATAEPEAEEEAEPEADAGMTFAPMAVQGVGAETKVVTFVYIVGGKEIDRQLVKAGDTLRDPGTPTVANKTFLGWNVDLPAAFGKEVTADALAKYKDGDKVTVTAKMQEFAYIQFVTDDGNTVYASGGQAGTDFTFENITYEPANDSQMVTGWQINGKDYVYGLSDTVRLPGVGETLTMKPVLSTRYWITFDSQGGSIVEPVSALSGQIPEKPQDPTKTGYTFAGWYTQAENGTQYTFRQHLTDDVQLYAHWSAVRNTTYTVVFWKQSVTDAYNAADANKTYDFWFSTTQNGTTDQKTNLTQNSMYNLLRGASEQNNYTGFHYRTVVNATIKADGSTVVNVYYDRDQARVVWNWTEGHRNQQDKTETWYGLYGQTFSQASSSYVWKSESRWRAGSKSGTELTILDAFINSTDDWSHNNNTYTLNLYKDGDNGSYTIYHYVEKPDGTYELKATAHARSSGWSVNNKFEGYTASYWSNDSRSVTNPSYRKSGDDAESDSKGKLWAFHTLNSYTLSYNAVDLVGTAKEVKSNNVKYTDALNNHKFNATTNEPTRPNNIPDYYVFKGWFYDPTGQEAVNWEEDTMPANNLAVYAVWGGKDVTVDFELSGGVIGGAQINKQTVKAGETAKDPGEPTREGFTFGGWLRNGAPFNFDTPITENTVLTAKWVSVATKVKIVYEAGENGTNPPADGNSYTVEAQAHARRGPDANDGYSFKGWVIQGDESGKVYVPGEAFTVSSEFIELDSEKNGTLTLVAQYVQTGDGTADLTYHSNYPANTLQDKAKVQSDIGVNTKYTLGGSRFAAPAGYEFKGWATSIVAAGAKLTTESVLVDNNDKNNDVYAVWSPLDFTGTITYTDEAGKTLKDKVTFKVEYEFDGDIFTDPWHWNVTSQIPGELDANGNHYILEGMPGNATGHGYQPGLTVNAKYTLDKNEDGKADKYQVFIKFVADDNGSVAPTEQVIDLGKGVTNGTVTASSTATPNETYRFKNWTSEDGFNVSAQDNSLSYSFAAEGGKTYTFTAHFELDEATLTVKFVAEDSDVELNEDFTDKVTIGEDYTVAGSETVTEPGMDENFKVSIPEKLTGSDGKTYVLDSITPKSGKMTGEGATVIAVYSLDEDGNGTPDKYEVTVTFEVKNGEWDNGGSDTVTRNYTIATKDETTGTWTLDNDVATEAPAAGAIPATGYMEGKWDKEVPGTVSKEMDNQTYTYTYVENPEDTVPTSYSVEYYKDGEKVAADSYTKESTDWAGNAEHKIAIQDEIDQDPDKYPGYTLESTSPTPVPNKGEMVDNGTVIKISYTQKADITITYTATEGGSVSNPSETLAPATGVATGSEATAAAGYHFVNWTDAKGKQVSTDPKFVPEKVDDLNVAATYTANFEKETYKVTVHFVADDETNLGKEDYTTEVVFDDTYNVSEEIPDSIEVGGVTYAKDSVTGDVSGKMPANDVKITVTYSKDVIGPEPGKGDNIPDKYQVTLKFKASPVEGGTVSATEGGEGSESYTQVVTLEQDGKYVERAGISIDSWAKANEGFTFVHWLTDIGPHPDAHFAARHTVNGGETYEFTAYFAKDMIGPDGEPDIHQVEVIYKAGDNGTVDPDGNYIRTFAENETSGTVDVHSVATPAEGYAFDYWDLNGAKIESGAELNGRFISDGDKVYTYTAHFDVDNNGDNVPDKYQVTVTYEIVNGKWSDSTIEAKTEVVTLIDEAGNWSEDGSATLAGQSGMTPNDGYTGGSWDPKNPGTVTKANNGATYKYSFEKGTYGYTVNYYYDGVPSETETGTGTFGDKIPYNTTTPKDYNEHHYVLESVTNKDGTITSDASRNVVEVHYALDEKGNDGKPDGTPDKYQITVHYTVENGTWSDDTKEIRDEIVTLTKDGKWDEDGEATLNPPADMKPAKGYQDAGAWNPGLPDAVTKDDDNTTYNYNFEKQSYNLTVHFVTDTGVKLRSDFTGTFKYEDEYSVVLPLNLLNLDDGINYTRWEVTPEDFAKDIKDNTDITVTAEMPAENLEVTVTYYKDVIGPKGDDGASTPDHIPDKFQVEIAYFADGYGTVNGKPLYAELKTFGEFPNYQEEGSVTASSLAEPNAGYVFDHWEGLKGGVHGTEYPVGAPKNANLNQVIEAKGGETYEFYAIFNQDINGDKIPDKDQNLTIVVSGITHSATYKGSEHDATGYTVRVIVESPNGKSTDDSYVQNKVPAWLQLKLDKEAKAVGIDVGYYPMGLSEENVHADVKGFGNITVKVNDGWLKINPKELTLKVRDAKKVYGDPDPKFTYTVSGFVNGEKVQDVLGEVIVFRTNQGFVEHVGKYQDVLMATYISPKNYTVKYENGDFEIAKRPATVTSASGEKEYDGKELTAPEVTGEGFIEGEGVTGTATGSQTLVGTSKNPFTYEANEGTDLDNYEIKEVEGDLTVTDRSEKYEITVQAKSDTVTYDGSEHSVSGFMNETLTFEVDDNTYTVEGLSASASGRDAGTYDAIVTGTAVVKDAAGNDVTKQFTVKTENGKLTINQKDVTITIKGETAEVVYDGAEHTISNHTVEGVPTDADFTVTMTGNITVAETEVGEYPQKMEGNFTVSESKNYNVTVEYEDGQLVILKDDNGDHIADKYQAIVYFVSAGNGSVDPTSQASEKLEEGTTVTMNPASTATAGTGYAFDHWTDNEGNVLPNGAEATDATLATELELTVGETYTYTAHFAEDSIGPDNGPDGTPDKYQATVTYEVENGSWADGSKATVTEVVTLTDEDGNNSETGSATLEKVPEVPGTPDTGYTGGAWNTTPPVTVTKTNDNTTYTYSYSKDSFDVTVKFVADDDADLGEEDYTESVEFEAEYDVSGNIPDSIVTPDGKTYVKDSVTDNVSGTMDADGEEVTATYSIDEKGTGPDGGPDGVADKYQVTLEYVADPAAGGSVSKTSEVVTIPGEKQTSGTVTAAANATANEGYVFDGWTSDVTIAAPDSAALSQSFQANGGETYIFTATFAADEKGEPDPENPDPENPEGGPDGTADKYQAFVVYQSAGNGTVDPSGLQTITFPDKATSGDVDAASVATAAEGYAFDYWDLNGTPFDSEAALSQTFEAQGNTTYTYTAHFAEDANDDNIPDYRQAVTVYVAGSKGTAVYDGEDHTVSGYEITGVTVGGVSAGTVLPNGVSINTTSATVTASAVGTHNMGLTADSFTVEKGTFQSVTVVVTDGWLQIYANTITPTDPTAPDPDPEPTPEPGEEPDPDPDPVYGGVTVGELEDVVYNGQSQAQTPTVTDKDGNPLPEGSYSVSWSEDTTNAGQVTVTVTGENGYTGSVTRTYNITPKGYSVTTESASKVYDGDELTAPGEIEGLVNEADATLNVTGSQTNVGTSRNTYTVEFVDEQMARNYQLESANVGTLTVTAQSIDPTDPTEPDPENPEQPVYGGVVIDDPSDHVYDGATHQWAPTVTDKDGNVLTEGVDYTVSYDTNDFTDAGTITVTIEGMGNYSGEVTKSYEITRRTVTLTSGTESWTYDGEAHRNETVAEGGEGFVAGEGASYSNFASITNEGSIPNTFEYALNEHTKAENYTITPSYGTLTVTAQSIDPTDPTEPDPENPEQPVYGGVVIDDPSNSVYDGAAHQWAPTVTDKDGNVLTEGVDYTVSYDTNDFTDAGTITVTIEGMGNYSGTVTKSYEITKRTVTLTSGTESWTYDGEAHSNETVTEGGEGFVAGEGASYSNFASITNEGSIPNTFEYALNENTKAENYTITPSYGTLTVTTQSIDPTDPTEPDPENPDKPVYGGVEINDPSNSVYDGATHQWAPTVTDKDGNVLTEGVDYTVSYSTDDFTDAGTITVTITGTGDYTGTVTKTYNITPAALTVNTASATRMYNGAALTAGGTIRGLVNNETATVNTTSTITNQGVADNDDYTITWGTAKRSNYTVRRGTMGTLTVTPRTVVMTSGSGTKLYDGAALTNGTVTVSGDGFINGEGATYNVTGTRTDVGSSQNTFTYTLNAGTLARNYNITRNYGTLTVNNVSILGMTVGTPTNFVYDGAAHQWAPTVSGNNGTLTAGTDYTVTYSTNDFTDVGTIRVTITGTGNYSGSVTRTYRITPRAVVMTSPSATKTYDGTALRATNVTATGFVAGEGASYNVTGTRTTVGSSRNGFTYTLNAGTDADNYTITQNYGTLTVNGLSIAGMAVGTPTNSVYDGATHQWTPTVTGNNGALRAGTDYTVTYSTGNFVDVGTIRVTITGRGNYTGTVTRTYRITPRAVTMTSASATKEYDARVLRDDDVTATGFVAGEGATYNVTGRRTTPGTSQNTFTYTLNANTDEDNYNIRQVYGNLTVTPVEAPEPTDAPEPTEIPEDDTPLGGLPEGMEPGYDLNEEVVITDDETPLAGGPTEQICCILHFILMLGALCVAMYYTHDRKKRQEREFELRSELQE